LGWLVGSSADPCVAGLYKGDCAKASGREKDKCSKLEDLQAQLHQGTANHQALAGIEWSRKENDLLVLSGRSTALK
jgi:hypothetical protein